MATEIFITIAIIPVSLLRTANTANITLITRQNIVVGDVMYLEEIDKTFNHRYIGKRVIR